MYEYPERLSRALMNEGLKKSRLPPRWVQDLFTALAEAMKKQK